MVKAIELRKIKIKNLKTENTGVEWVPLKAAKWVDLKKVVV